MCVVKTFQYGAFQKLISFIKKADLIDLLAIRDGMLFIAYSDLYS